MVRLSCADFALRGIGWGVGITSASADAAMPKLTLGFEYAGWIPVTVARQPMARQAGKAGRVHERNEARLGRRIRCGCRMMNGSEDVKRRNTRRSRRSRSAHNAQNVRKPKWMIGAILVAVVVLLALAYKGGRWLETRNANPETRGDYQLRQLYQRHN